MNTTTTTPEKTNDLRHTINTTYKGNPLIIKISLNDECKNGHQDFSITGTTYRPFERGDRKDGDWKVFNGKNYTFDSGGCIHETILKAKPELQIFVKLHLCDYKGIPMHASANGWYHLKNGFNRTKPEDQNFVSEYCEYYRITPEQFAALAESHSETHFAMNLERLGIFQQWEEEANKAIKQLEELTGKTFVVDSKKTQYHRPSDEKIKEEETRLSTGYYSPEQIAAREEQKKVQEFEKLEQNRQKEIEKINLEYDVKKEVLKVGGKTALDNCIFYNHTKELSFNWKSYDRIEESKLQEIIKALQLPEGVTVTIK